MDTKFGMNVSNIMLLNAEKFWGYSFYRFWVIKGKPTGGVKSPPPSITQIRVNKIKLFREEPDVLWISSDDTGYVTERKMKIDQKEVTPIQKI